MITVLSTIGCSQCSLAKTILRQKDLHYAEVSADSLPGKAMIAEYNIQSLPFILFNGEPIYNIKKLMEVTNELS